MSLVDLPPDRLASCERLDRSNPLWALRAVTPQFPLVPATDVIFRETPVGGVLDFHPARRRQFVVPLSGVGEGECGDESRSRNPTVGGDETDPGV